MLDTRFLFKEMSTSYFLYYSWIELKVLANLDIGSKYRHISLRWFTKASFLLKSGLYDYSSNKLTIFKVKLSKKKDLINLRNKIIEMAIFNIIYPFFYTYTFRKNFLLLNDLCFTLESKKMVYPFFNNSCSKISSYFSLKSHLFASRAFMSLSLRKRGLRQIFFTLEKIKKWNTSILYFIKFDVLKSSSFVSKNRLKNIFLRIIKDRHIWDEISKMMNSSFIKPFDYNSIIGDNYNDINSLSFLLFNIYLSELDLYLFNLTTYFNSKYTLFKNFFYTKLFKFNQSVIDFPLKVNYLCLNDRRNYVNLPLKLNQTCFNSFYFQKDIYYARYLNYFLIGAICSSVFLTKLKFKVISYLRGNLKLEINNFYLLSCNSRSIYFLGYKIALTDFNFCNTDSTLSNEKEKLNKKIFSRLSSFKISTNKVFLTRIYYEFFFQIDFCLKNSFRSLFRHKFKDFYLRLFCYEAIKGFYSRKEGCLYNFNSLLESEKYLKAYFFDLFLFKVKKIISVSELYIYPYLYKSYLPTDLSFNLLLREFNVNSSFLYYSLFDLVADRSIYLRSYFGVKKSIFSGFLFSELDLLNTNNYYLNMKKITLTNFSIIRILIPTELVISKLRQLGFFHPFLNRAIGNISFFRFEDYEIIMVFNYFSYIFLIWYKKAFNFYKVKVILTLLTKSCFFTLSRKHKKSRYWINKVYTVALLNNYYSIFQGFDKFSLMKIKSFYLYENFFLNF
uniref:Maturase n=1 Tax=Lepocinclis steinii TaxID=459226 RepID=A0A3G3LLL1_9EUGL|nr:maturase [Lepocinclis steinii]AYQ93596.1 maturase [Lepocinclis steinii]